ncbi:MAG TPA: hypothetical protein VLA11_04295 [Woeseiaceae bacterium]|jgi:hypothetical protein|nr:hypothetical protein [Woeseiaceae bacterium]
MNRLLLLLLLAGAFATAPLAQESDSGEAPATTEAGPDENAGSEGDPDEDSALADVSDEEIEELLGLDEDYGEYEDDFDPTEEVRFEQSIPFPVDI